MEILQKLTRKQLTTLQIIDKNSSSTNGVSLKDIASELGVKPPSALELVRVLEDFNLVERTSRKRKLSESGRKCIEEYNRHHRVTEVLFAKLLDSDSSHKAAREVDMWISHETVDKLCAAEGHPKECPHGHPIMPCDHEED